LRIFADDQITASQIIIHMLHRIWACVTAGFVIWTAFKLRKYSGNKRLSSFSLILFCMVLIQLTLGAFTVLTRKAVDITTIHVATGALLLVITFLTSLHTIKLFGMAPRKVHLPLTAKEVTA